MANISFPQFLAISKGGNYVLNEKFPGFNPLTTNITIQAFPSGSKFVPDIHNTSAHSHTLATSTTQEPAGNFVYKAGGNISTATVMSTYKYPDIRELNNTGAPDFNFQNLVGDWLFIRANSNHTNTGTITRTSSGVALQPIISSTVSSGPRAILVGSLFSGVSGNPQYTNQSQAHGFIKPNLNQDLTFEFVGRVDLLPKNNLGDYRILVGFFRDHAGALSVPFHPTGSGPNNKHNQDLVAAFMPFLTGATLDEGNWIGGSFNWFVVLLGQTLDDDNIVIYTEDTGISAHSDALLKMVWSGRIITWMVNTSTVHTVDLSTLDATIKMAGYNIHAGCSIRETKANDNSIPISDFPEFTNRLIVNYMTLTPDPWESSTATTLNATEISYHTTGLQLLKKLK